MLFGLAPQLESQVAEEQQPGLQTPSSSAALLDLSGTHKHTKGKRLKHHRGLSEKCPQNTRRQPQIYAGERRRIDYVWSNILLYYSSDVTLSLSRSVLSICRLRGFSPDRSEMPLTGSAASERRLCCPSSHQPGRSSVPAPAESRPQPARNPPPPPPQAPGTVPGAPWATAGTNSWIVMPLSVTTAEGVKSGSEKEGGNSVVKSATNNYKQRPKSAHKARKTVCCGAFAALWFNKPSCTAIMPIPWRELTRQILDIQS